MTLPSGNSKRALTLSLVLSFSLLIVLLGGCVSRHSSAMSWGNSGDSPEPSALGLLVLTLGDVALREPFDCWYAVPLSERDGLTFPELSASTPLHGLFVRRQGLLRHLERTILNESVLRDKYELRSRDTPRGLDRVLGHIIEGDLVGALPKMPSAAFSLGTALIEGQLAEWQVRRNVEKNAERTFAHSEKTLPWLLLLPAPNGSQNGSELQETEECFLEALKIGFQTADDSLFRAAESGSEQNGALQAEFQCDSHLKTFLERIEREPREVKSSPSQSPVLGPLQPAADSRL